MPRSKFLWWKLIAVWIVFLLLHFSYNWFPGLLFRVIAEPNETIFFHMKMLFVAYSMCSLVEFFIRRSILKSASSFWTSRALIAVAFPWLAITFWFLASALNITFSTVWEILYSNVMTLLGIYLAIRLDETLEEVDFRPAIQWMIGVLFMVAVLVYILFSLHPPIHFFTTPPGL